MAWASPEKLKALQRFFDHHAAGWNDMVSPRHAQQLRKMMRRLPLFPEARILDVGCGTGVLFPILADRLHAAGLIIAVDVSRNMTRETRRSVSRLAQCQPLPLWLVLQADVTCPPLPCASFDWVICNSCFPHFQDQSAALSAMAELLTPAGRLVICHTESREAINALHRRVGGEVGGHELPASQEMTALVLHAGLQLETLEDDDDYYFLVAKN